MSATAVVVLGSSGLLSHWWSLFVYGAGQVGAALAATVACWVTARRHTGGRRWCRLFTGAATCSWMIGQIIWSWYQLVRGVALPFPSLADAGYLGLPLFALAAIVCYLADRPSHGVPRHRSGQLVMLLDGLIVVGSLFVLTWATTLGSVVRAGAATPLAFSIAIAFPIANLLLTVIIILLIASASSAANRLPMIILGAGLFCVAISDSLFAYEVSVGAHSVPLLLNAGYLAGLALVAIAALTPAQQSLRWETHPDARWGYLLLPYVPVAGVVVLFVVQWANGTRRADPVQVAVGGMVIALLIIRQAVTLVQSANLVASRARLVIAADQTRRRLERDLHDGVQQRLISLALFIRQAEADVPPELPRLQQRLSTIVAGLTDTVDEVREISRGVHPAIVTEGGLRPALRALARRSTVPLELDVRVDGRQPEPIEVAAYYVAAEALNNATKYAEATVVQVDAKVRGGYLHLSVSDDGIGGADPKRGTGLTGLTDRVEAVGGTLTLDSPLGHGTRLHADFPLDQS